MISSGAVRVASDIMLGIDTGGTYTDAVLYNETQGLIAKAKALTTRHDLAIGISGAVDSVFSQSGVEPARIGLVSLSTTLATNALVEGQGGRAALIMIGFEPDDLKRDGLAEALGSDPVIFLPGGHDVHGNEKPLDLTLLAGQLPLLSETVSSFSVAGYFAVRNPSHEIRVRDFIREHTSLPVTCSHELSSKLGGPRRALTTLLNARLVSMIDRLIGACEGFMHVRGIAAPMMVVRGDGALISAAQARERPIETILSGPAASLVGARHLTGLDNAIVSDIGGTTTDIAVLDNGRPRLDVDGAVVGGYRTMVEAVAMRTYGLGGDSEVRIDDRGLTARVHLGPRRAVPLSLAATLHGESINAELERQLRSGQIGRHDGRFAVLTGLPDRYAAGLEPKDAELYARIDATPVPLADLLTFGPQKAILDRLVARGLVHICAVTPSDAMHVLGRQNQWSGTAAELGLRLMARQRDGAGRAISADATAMAEMILARLTRHSAEIILGSALAEDGLPDIDPAKSVLIERALDRAEGTVQFSVSLDRPLIGLGASAPVYYPSIASILSVEHAIPSAADVANAVGAVVGQIREVVNLLVTTPEEGRFVLSGAGEIMIFFDEEQAIDEARRRAGELALARAKANGAEDAVVNVEVSSDAPEVEGSRKLIEARIIATATGRPRITNG